MLANAERVCKSFVDQVSSMGIPKERIWFKALVPEGGE